MRVLGVAVGVCLLGSCSGSAVGIVPAASASVVSARIITSVGTPVSSAVVRLNLVRRTSEQLDTIGACVGRIVGNEVNVTTSPAGDFLATLIDYNPTTDSLCIAIAVTRTSSNSFVFSIPSGPFPVDPSYGQQPRDTVKLVLVMPQSE